MTDSIENQIPDGWTFLTADFSVRAARGNRYAGSVILIRTAEQKQIWHWHNISSNIEDEDDLPKLYAKGFGYTIEEALKDAISKTSPPLYQ